MSSWERSRYIPWSRIPSDPDDLTYQKERIFRDLQREADQQIKKIEEDNRRIQQQPQSSTSTNDLSSLTENSQGETTTATTTTSIPFRWGDLFRRAAFGGCIGTITGSVFGFMDGMRVAQTSEVLKNASNVAKGRYLMEGTTRSATTFGVFFGGFHVVKYGIHITLDPGEYTEVGLAGAVSLGALMTKPSYRAAIPYGSMLIIMDSVHLLMRSMEK
mmetsp:Transcript_24104/g.57001  ORF Transcript_24104/g.57001 Transcript_24104/m.57001 type:complete len:216 (+) Transcript_24104:116-763(+)